MSRMVMKVLLTDGTVRNHQEYKNAWGFAPYIWDVLVAKYVSGARHWMLDKDAQQRLWSLAKDPAVPLHERKVLLSTFDWAIVPQALFGRMADWMRQFRAETYCANKVCHLPEIAEELGKIPQAYRGVCFYGTSVSEDLWIVREGETERPYDITRDQGHFFIEP